MLPEWTCCDSQSADLRSPGFCTSTSLFEVPVVPAGIITLKFTLRTSVLALLASLPSYKTFVPWLPSRISGSESRMSNSEFWLLEEQMQERHPSCSESATPRKVPGSTGLISGDSALRYVLTPDGSSSLQSHSLVRLNSTLQLRLDRHILCWRRLIVTMTIVFAAWPP